MEKADTEKKYALATVTSASFVPGTMVMLASFFKHNKGFDGDILIIHKGLEEQYQYLLSHFKRVKFIEASDTLVDKIKDLAGLFPTLKKKAARFFSLEVFRLTGYSRIFFCDSDIVFNGSLSDFPHGPGLLCCGDHCHYSGKTRDARTFLPVDAGDRGKPLENTFNSGFMIIDDVLLTPGHYRGLLDLLTPGVWKQIKAPHTDQIILNLYFQGRCRLLSGRYNLLVPFGQAIMDKEGFSQDDIKVLHFIGPVKPWNCLETMAMDPDGAVLRFLSQWHSHYLDLLPRIHLRNRLEKRRPGKLEA
ncbi:MAG: hypothetical protein MI863_20195 [Desulfobacterales bacterium]|nr:hypothetical protein [Desulfobacterales bacterium]